MVAGSVKILLVDDDEELLESVSEIFKLFGFQIEKATSGNKAWQKIESDKFDLVITDIRMPDGDGIELLNKCKKRNLDSPKVLFVSGFHDYSIAELYEMGVDGFFEKPFDASAVRAAIKDCLQDLDVLWGNEASPNIVQHILFVKSFLKAEEEKEFLFGRRGLFLHIENNFPEVGQIVSFEVEGEPLTCGNNIWGYGKVVWVRDDLCHLKSGDKELLPGVGVLIQFINDQTRKDVVDWVEKNSFRPIIPYGFKNN